jgi:uncharacterized protein YodC (DUF2158 family)
MISCHDRSLGWDRYHVVKELVMDLKPGDVVILKSGGHPLSVVEVNDGKVVCVWMGNEGDLFRETLPLAVLELAEPEHEDDEDEDEDEDDEHDEEEEDEDDGKKA